MTFFSLIGLVVQMRLGGHGANPACSPGSMSGAAKTGCKSPNLHSYIQALKQRGSLTVWFDPEMQLGAVPSGRRGRRQAFSGKAEPELIRACLTLEVFLGLPLRRGEPIRRMGSGPLANEFVASPLEPSGPGWSVPDFSPRHVARRP